MTRWPVVDVCRREGDGLHEWSGEGMVLALADAVSPYRRPPAATAEPGIHIYSVYSVDSTLRLRQWRPTVRRPASPLCSHPSVSLLLPRASGKTHVTPPPPSRMYILYIYILYYIVLYIYYIYTVRANWNRVRGSWPSSGDGGSGGGIYDDNIMTRTIIPMVTLQ